MMIEPTDGFPIITPCACSFWENPVNCPPGLKTRYETDFKPHQLRENILMSIIAEVN
jgi:hypothetical protein